MYNSLSDASGTAINVVVAVLAIIIVLTIVLTPLIRWIINKKKGITTTPKCTACADSKTVNGKTNIKINYDKKYNDKKKE